MKWFNSVFSFQLIVVSSLINCTAAFSQDNYNLPCGADAVVPGVDANEVLSAGHIYSGGLSTICVSKEDKGNTVWKSNVKTGFSKFDDELNVILSFAAHSNTLIGLTSSYINNGKGVLFAIQASSGSLLWQKDLSFENDEISLHGFSNLVVTPSNDIAFTYSASYLEGTYEKSRQYFKIFKSDGALKVSNIVAATESPPHAYPKNTWLKTLKYDSENDKFYSFGFRRNFTAITLNSDGSVKSRYKGPSNLSNRHAGTLMSVHELGDGSGYAAIVNKIALLENEKCSGKDDCFRTFVVNKDGSFRSTSLIENTDFTLSEKLFAVQDAKGIVSWVWPANNYSLKVTTFSDDFMETTTKQIFLNNSDSSFILANQHVKISEIVREGNKLLILGAASSSKTKKIDFWFKTSIDLASGFQDSLETFSDFPPNTGRVYIGSEIHVEQESSYLGSGNFLQYITYKPVTESGASQAKVFVKSWKF